MVRSGSVSPCELQPLDSILGFRLNPTVLVAGRSLLASPGKDGLGEEGESPSPCA